MFSYMLHIYLYYLKNLIIFKSLYYNIYNTINDMIFTLLTLIFHIIHEHVTYNIIYIKLYLYPNFVLY